MKNNVEEKEEFFRSKVDEIEAFFTSKGATYFKFLKKYILPINSLADQLDQYEYILVFEVKDRMINIMRFEGRGWKYVRLNDLIGKKNILNINAKDKLLKLSDEFTDAVGCSMYITEVRNH